MQATPFAEQLAKPIGEALDSLRSSVRSAREFEPASSKRRFKIYLSDNRSGAVPAAAPRLPQGQCARRDAQGAAGCRCAIRTSRWRAARWYLASPLQHAGTRLSPEEATFRERYVCVVRKGHPYFPLTG
jgi:DNA-binding transcriptional LysR family regulator